MDLDVDYYQGHWDLGLVLYQKTSYLLIFKRFQGSHTRERLIASPSLVFQSLWVALS